MTRGRTEQVENEIEEMWERICDAGEFEGSVEYDVRGLEVVLRDEYGFELGGSVAYIRGYLHGRIDGENI